MKRENAMQASDFETLGVPAGSMRFAHGGWPFQRSTSRAPFHKRVVVLLGVTQVVVVPLAGLFLHADLWPVLPGLLAVLLLGNVSFATLATLFAAVAARTRARETLLLLLPLALPLLIAAVQATQAVLAGGLGAAREAVAVLVAFDVIFAVAGWLLFAYVVRG
jgi:ABC-type transport system involved in cytochrome c biogenesis permease component